jgi:magnesium and cobalt exporter, CNNM family
VHVHSPVEIQLLLAESRKGGTLSPEATARLERGLLLSTRTVRQLMVPRGELVAIEAATPAEEILRAVLESPYSRLPVYRKDLDHLIGTVSTKDVVALYASRGDIPPLEQLLRPIPFVPENLRADRLVRFLQERRSSKAIVVDEFGGVQGIVSIEDVLGELFGDIGDELKASDVITEPLADGRVRLPGSMSLEEAEPWLGTRWQGNSATVGGHIVNRLGRLPQAGEHIEVDGVNLTILDMTPTTVGRVLVHDTRHSSQPARSESQLPRGLESIPIKSERTG